MISPNKYKYKNKSIMMIGSCLIKLNKWFLEYLLFYT